MSLLDWIFPRSCFACRHPSADPLCTGCAASQDWIAGPTCVQCGAPANALRLRCVDCVGKPMEFNRAIALALYTGAIRDMILGMKRESCGHLADYFARQLARRLTCSNFDLIVPVPIDRSSFRIRGYGAAPALAADLSRHLRVPGEYSALVKWRSTRSQKELPLEWRKKNPFGAYRCPRPERVRGKRILIVDDVLTTGATLSACTRPLMAAGAQSVCVAVVARG